MLRPVTAGAVMYAAVYGIQKVAYGVPSDWFYLLQLVAAGTLSYGVAMLLIDRNGVRETLALVRR